MAYSPKIETELAKELQAARKRISELEQFLASQSVEQSDETISRLSDTDQIRSELETQNRFITQIADTSPVGITRVNKHGEITFANRRAEEIFGLSKTDIESRTYKDPEWKITDFNGNAFPEENLPFVIARKTGKPIFGVQHAIEWPDGKRVLLSINVTPLFDRDNEFDGIISTIEDITARTQTENELRGKDKYFRALIENVSDVISILDAGGNVVYESPSHKVVLGYETGELIGQNIFSYVHEEDRERIMLEFASHMQEPGDIAPVSFRFLRKDGRWINLEGTGHNLLHDPVINGIIVNYRDVTERIRIADSLNKSEEWLKSILTSVPAGVGVLKDRVLMEVNKVACEMVGYTRDDLIGESARIFFPSEEEYQHVDQEEYRQIEEYGTGQVETRWQRKDGGIIDIIMSSTPIDSSDLEKGVTFSAIDITQRKNTERALRENEYFLRKAQEVAHLGCYSFDIQKNKWVSSDILDDIFGIGPDFPRNAEGWAEIIHPDHRDMMTDYLHNYVLTEGNLFDKEYLILRVDTREQRWVHGKGELKYDSNNVPVEMIGTIQDITELRRASDVLRESEEKLREAQEMVHLGYWFWEVKTGKVQWSDEVYRIFGFDPETYTPHIDSIMELSPWPGENKRNQELIQRAIKSKEQGQYEQRFLFPDGSDGYYASTFQGVYDAKGELTAIKGTVLDITERKKTELALSESEGRFRSITEQLSDMISLTDETGFITYVSPVCETMFRVDSEEMVGKHFMEYLDESAIPIAIKNFQESLEGNYQIRNLELLMKRGDGSRFTGELHGSPFNSGSVQGVLVVIRDITERKQAERALRESEQTHRSLLRNLNSGVVVHGSDTRVLLANDAACNLLGLSEDQMRGKEVIDPEWRFVSEDMLDLPLELYPVNQVISTQAPIYNKIIGVRRTNPDDLAWGIVNGFPVFNELHEIEQVVINFIDYTELKKTQEEKDKLENQLQQSQKMESIGRLAGGVAHDFNNLLTGITGNVSLGMLDLSPDDPLYETLGEIEKAAKSAAGLTRQLLAFSRKQIISPKVINLNELIENIRKMLERLIGEDIHLRIIPDRNLGRVKVDPGQIEQIIVNLSVNARDAMPDGGKLTIETQNKVLDEQYCKNRPNVNPGEFVMLAISDNGVGMDSNTQLKIFDPFYTTKNVGEGTGLGLSTSYGIVKQHNGYIQVYSELGKGTTFKVYFPKVEDEAEDIKENRVINDLPRGTETILVVEDESLVRNIAIKILKRQGYKVLCADNGPNALAIVEQEKPNIDLLLTDMVMPYMNGRELSNRLAKAYPVMKILFSSGYTENVIAHHGVLDDGVNFIGKPYSPQELAKKVRNVLDE